MIFVQLLCWPLAGRLLGGWPICLQFKYFLSQFHFNIVTSQVLHIFQIYLLKKSSFYTEI